MGLTEIKAVETEAAPTEPVVPCLHCRKDFVWWLHPVQLCDDCVERELATSMPLDNYVAQESATSMPLDNYGTQESATSMPLDNYGTQESATSVPLGDCPHEET